MKKLMREGDGKQCIYLEWPDYPVFKGVLSPHNAIHTFNFGYEPTIFLAMSISPGYEINMMNSPGNSHNELESTAVCLLILQSKYKLERFGNIHFPYITNS